MAETILIDTSAPKEVKYEQLLPQLKALVGEDRHRVAVLANVAAALHQAFAFLWTGFYTVEEGALVLGPFQGPVACMRIDYGKGVCGTAWERGESIVVPDVDLFPGHIACSSESRSEIVVPLRDRNNTVRAVLDIDSATLNTFDQSDREYLEKLCNWLGEILF